MGASEESTIGQRYVLAGPVAEDQVVMDGKVEDLRALDELPREPDVFLAWSRIAVRMAVDQDQ